jgi:hypothetical protein
MQIGICSTSEATCPMQSAMRWVSIFQRNDFGYPSLKEIIADAKK